MLMHVIFTGGNYYAVPELPQISEGADFKMVSGLRWIKSRRAFSNRWKLFACPRGYQRLTREQQIAQGIVHD